MEYFRVGRVYVYRCGSGFQTACCFRSGRFVESSSLMLFFCWTGLPFAMKRKPFRKSAYLMTFIS
jgi:hypothetical protein